jgi:hypothetical protein
MRIAGGGRRPLAFKVQIVTLKRGQNVKYAGYAFTEHGAIMAATVLNSPRTVQMSVFVVRAFIRMRAVFKDSADLAHKLALLENELKQAVGLLHRPTEQPSPQTAGTLVRLPVRLRNQQSPGKRGLGTLARL